MKHHFTIMLILFIFCISGCSTKPQTSTPSTSNSSQSEEILIEEKSQIINLKEYSLEQSAERYLGNLQKKLDTLSNLKHSNLKGYVSTAITKFLYVTDPEGNPISNLKCCTKGELESIYIDYITDFSGISMGNGLLPVSVWRTYMRTWEGEQLKSDIKMFQSPAYTLFLVNDDIDGEPYVQEITVDFTALTENNALSVVWTGPTPEETAIKSEKVLEINISNPDGTPASNCYVDVDGTSSLRNPAIGGRNPDDNGRYTNKNGTVYFVIDSFFSQRMKDGTELYLFINVSDSCLDSSPEEHQSTCVNPCPDGEPINIILIRNKEEDTLWHSPIIDLKAYRLDKYAEPYLKELKAAFSDVWPECTAKFLYITNPDGQPISNIKCCTKEELETILGKTDKPDFSGISMKNGLLPVSMRRAGAKNPAEMFQSSAYTMFLVNADADGEPYVQEITVDFTALNETNALTVVWKGPIPEETAKSAEKVTAVTVYDAENEPMPNCFVELDGKREDGRYTDKDGTAFFVIDGTFPKEYQEGPVCDLEVKTSDYSLYYPQKKSQSIVINGYIDGKRTDSLNLTRTGEELAVVE